ncbi:hypothetical protein HH308_06245 [Gordonia sp. TBRC 11910]|uniref:Uncharacterized protein n=1 Tax=Gordonia asplenii TaxID=2725283 RepID=A0A848KRD3_9ACTN|nr:hypothetical protein [Gordonia asplenii]NMO00812.1 hypothetical protein [Gordonia asplenii]
MALRLVPRPESTAAQHAPPVDGTLALARIRGEHGVVTLGVTPDNAPRALTAAAAILAGGANPASKLRVGSRPWQTEVWELRRETGEMRFSGDRVAKALSRVKLYIAEVSTDPDADPKPAEVPELQDLSQQMFTDCAAALLRAGQHLQFSGESVLLISQDMDTLAMTWQPHSTREVSGQGKSWQIDDGSGERRRVDLKREMLVRCWLKDPEMGYNAESPVQAVMPSARILRALTRRISAEIDSRLAGNGLLVLPDSVQLAPGQMGQDGKATHDFMRALMQSMITPIQQPDSAAAVVPLVIQVPIEAVDKIQHIRFSSDFDQRTKELRDEEIRRIALGMDSAPEVLLGMGSGANHWCVDERTEILTRDGWKRQHDLAVGDVALTLNHDTGMSEWQPVLDVYRADVTDEPMRFIQTQRHNSLTTMNHRWPVIRQRNIDHLARDSREWTTSAELDVPHSIVTGAPNADTPTVAKHSDALVELIAWYWTEGNLGSKRRVTIAQSHTVNQHRVDRIRAALTDMFGPGRDTLRHAGAPAWREVVQANDNSHGGPVTVFKLNRQAGDLLTEHAPGRGKLVRREFVESLTRAQLELFIDVSCQGDGWHYRSGKLDIWQRNPRALEAFELALILSGRAVSTHQSDGGTVVAGLTSTRQRPGKDVNGRRPVVIEHYSGVVWCPVTENRTWFARRNGQTFYTGNSAWQIDESEAKFVIAPLAATVCHALTVGWLQPCTKQLGLDPRRYIVHYDLAALQLRPDRSADAREMYRDGALSVQAALRENGFDPEDQATELPPAMRANQPPAQPTVAPRPSSQSNPIPNQGQVP